MLMDRKLAARVAADTVAAVERGWYANSRGERVEIARRVAAYVAGTVLFRPDGWPAVHRQAEAVAANAAASPERRPTIDVTGETTLAAARRLLGDGAANVLALNFASAKNPGGGFLGGSRAQEESLARPSALYATLVTKQGYYDANRAGPRAVYTAHAICSPAVPVLRADDGAWLDVPYDVSFVTMPAANVSAMRQGGGRVDADLVERTMTRRVGHVLALAAARGHRALVLGAWGCGVFGNDLALIARLFADALAGPVAAAFDRVTFAVFDPSPDQGTLGAFRAAFEGGERVSAERCPGGGNP